MNKSPTGNERYRRWYKTHGDPLWMKKFAHQWYSDAIKEIPNFEFGDNLIESILPQKQTIVGQSDCPAIGMKGKANE